MLYSNIQICRKLDLDENILKNLTARWSSSVPSIAAKLGVNWSQNVLQPRNRFCFAITLHLMQINTLFVPYAFTFSEGCTSPGNNYFQLGTMRRNQTQMTLCVRVSVCVWNSVTQSQIWFPQRLHSLSVVLSSGVKYTKKQLQVWSSHFGSTSGP